MAAPVAARRLLVDVHTHLYLPKYAQMLRSRTIPPRIVTGDKPFSEERLIILHDEPSEGRPFGSQYYDKRNKLDFMEKQDIDVSILSSANPWLDFLDAPTAVFLARDLNEEMETYCATSDEFIEREGLKMKRLYGFGLLPLVEGVTTSELIAAVCQVDSLPHLRGIILGTKGIGAGLDDDELEPLWNALSRTGLVAFLHPHYGVGSSSWGPKDNGHVLPLALGFPFETTVAATRMILSGVFDRHPDLKVLLAHSGGALPQLSSRLTSCVAHDPRVAQRLKHDARWYLTKFYYDAVAYGAEELSIVSKVIQRVTGGKASERIMFGTDHPFFPPLHFADRWASVDDNVVAIGGVSEWSDEEKTGVYGLNAVRLFDLNEHIDSDKKIEDTSEVKSEDKSEPEDKMEVEKAT